jgi:CotH kinase protein/Lamin Tail Domain
MTKISVTCFCLLGLLLILCCKSYGQRLPEYTLGFAQNEIASIYIQMPADSVLAMYTSGSDVSFTASFSFDGLWSDTTDLPVTMRLRGNTSLNAYKKSFRINFDGVDGSQEWHGLEKMNLIGLQNDPSLLRSKLCHDAFRQAGVFSAQTAFVKLFINDEYMGVYQHQEHIDEEFCKLYFDQQGDGNLYKCTYPATLEYLGTNPTLYQFALWGTRQYELKTNEWRDNYTDLAQFIAVLNNTPINDLACALPLVFDVETYLKTMAIDVITGNWDNYIYNKNNFYLYHHQLSDQFVYLPYDLDNTLGIDWVGIDWTVRNPYSWQPTDDDRPLFERILDVDVFRQQFSNYLLQYSQTFLGTTELTNSAQQWQAMITDAALADTYRTLDFGFDDDAFLLAISETWGNHVAQGITSFADLRNGFLSFQIEPTTTQQTVVHWLNQTQLCGENANTIKLVAFIEAFDNDFFSLEISPDNVSFTTVDTFNDTGEWGDDQSNDQLYTALIDLPFSSDQLYYRLLLSNGNHYPCEAKMMWVTTPSNGIVINEIMTQNDSYFADETGAYDDWVELYNASTSDININGYYLTDDVANMNLFPLPAVTINAGEFLIVWLDDDVSQGNLHANFKMGSTDNALWLVKTQTNKLRIQDGFTPCISGVNQSQERSLDGGPDIQLSLDPTPDYSNITTIVERLNPTLAAYPNPTNGIIHFQTVVAAITLIDAVGRELNHYQQVHSIDLSKYPSGSYYLRTGQGQLAPIQIIH